MLLINAFFNAVNWAFSLTKGNFKSNLKVSFKRINAYMLHNKKELPLK